MRIIFRLSLLLALQEMCQGQQRSAVATQVMQEVAPHEEAELELDLKKIPWVLPAGHTAIRQCLSECHWMYLDTASNY